MNRFTRNVATIAPLCCLMLLGANNGSAQILTEHPSMGDEVDYQHSNWSQMPATELVAILKSANPARIPTNAWGGILRRVDWDVIPPTRRLDIGEHLDWSLIPSNIWEKLIHPNPWPQGANREATLKKCAELLHQSVDSSHLLLVSTHLKLLPPALLVTNGASATGHFISVVTNADIVLLYDTFIFKLTNVLSACAGYLSDSNLNVYIGDGYSAKIQTPQKSTETTYYLLWSENGPVRSIRQMVGDARATVSAQFARNGKLASFEIYTATPNSTRHNRRSFESGL